MKKVTFVILKIKKMKKILLVALALLITGTMFADKKCCKDKANCKKETAAKSCSHDEAKGGKACCKKGTASAEGATTSDAAVVATADAPQEMHACCKKAVAGGGKACCAKGGAHAEAPKQAPAKAPAATPVRDDQNKQ